MREHLVGTIFFVIFPILFWLGAVGLFLFGTGLLDIE